MVILWPLHWFQTIACEKVLDSMDLNFSRFTSLEIFCKKLKIKLWFEQRGRFRDWVDPVSNWVLTSFSLYEIKGDGREKGKEGEPKKLLLKKKTHWKKKVLVLVVQSRPWQKKKTPREVLSQKNKWQRRVPKISAPIFFSAQKKKGKGNSLYFEEVFQAPIDSI